MGQTTADNIATLHAARLGPGQADRSYGFETILPRQVVSYGNAGTAILRFTEIWNGVGAESAAAGLAFSMNDQHQPVSVMPGFLLLLVADSGSSIAASSTPTASMSASTRTTTSPKIRWRRPRALPRVTK